MTGLTPRVDRGDDRRYGARSVPDSGDIQTLHLRVSVLPAAIMAALGAAIVAFVLAGSPTATVMRVVLTAGATGAALVLLAAAYGAKVATHRVHRQLGALRAVTSRAQEDLQRLTERVRRGDRPVPRLPRPLRAVENDPFTLLIHDLERVQHAAEQSVLQVASPLPDGEAEQRVEVFVNLARRMQSLVHREIQMLDDLESQVEDPDLLKGLFTVDHLATRMRRQSESLAVLGGAISRRQWRRPVTVQEALRAAVAEVEQYSRVKVVPPIEGTLQGTAVADIIHLIAELIENATKFSAPHTQVLLRAQAVTAGLAIEVEDRGLGMLPADQQRMNGLLAEPGLVNINDLLRDGRIGLFVVSTLARRHGIKAQLQSNIYGGIQAVVVLPKALIDQGTREREAREETQPDSATAAVTPALEASLLGTLPPPVSSPPPLPARPAPLGSDLRVSPATGGQYAPDRQGATAPTAPSQPEPDQARPGELDTRPGQGSLAATASGAHRLPPRPADPGELPTDSGERPPLPKRKVQTHLAPQLRDAPANRRDEPPADQIPGLMAAFQRGINRAEEEDFPGTE